MNYYPYINPIILTDPIFFDYGGHRGSSSPEQRQAAYWIAERTASEDINTYLLPTIVTGSYIYNPLRDIILEHGYINQIIETRFIDKEENIYFTVSGINNVYVGLKDDERGVVVVVSNWFNLGELYKNQIIYNAGLPSGTSFRPDILLGLTTYADIILNEIQGYGNEAPGDIGVTDYRNQGYSESRVALIRTAFGTSARAQFVHKLFTKLRHYRWVGL
jgi:hypothetical protein